MYLHFQELTLSKSILLALKKGLLRPKRKILMISYLILSRISRFCFQSLIPKLDSGTLGINKKKSQESVFVFFYFFGKNFNLGVVENVDSSAIERGLKGG